MDHVIARHEHFLKNNWQEAAIKWVEKTYGEEADVSTDGRGYRCFRCLHQASPGPQHLYRYIVTVIQH
jgi:hypothetical protein